LFEERKQQNPQAKTTKFSKKIGVENIEQVDQVEKRN